MVGRTVGRSLTLLSRRVLRTNVSHVSLEEEKLILRQAGTWDPLLQCLHLDKPLLQQQNTKKLQGTKNNFMHGQLGQIMNKKIQKDQNPTATSEVSRAKAGDRA